MNEKTIDGLTVEHLGTEATPCDLIDFKTACKWLKHDRGISDVEAIEIVWNNGDYLEAISRLGRESQ